MASDFIFEPLVGISFSMTYTIHEISACYNRIDYILEVGFCFLTVKEHMYENPSHATDQLICIIAWCGIVVSRSLFRQKRGVRGGTTDRQMGKLVNYTIDGRYCSSLTPTP